MLDFLDLNPSLEPIVNIIFLAVTGVIAWKGLHARNEDGKADILWEPGKNHPSDSPDKMK